MTRLFFTNPLAAIKAANKYERLGYIVSVSADGDVVIIDIARLEAA